jgi:hypothetical protein
MYATQWQRWRLVPIPDFWPPLAFGKLERIVWWWEGGWAPERLFIPPPARGLAWLCQTGHVECTNMVIDRGVRCYYHARLVNIRRGRKTHAVTDDYGWLREIQDVRRRGRLVRSKIDGQSALQTLGEMRLGRDEANALRVSGAGLRHAEGLATGHEPGKSTLRSAADAAAVADAFGPRGNQPGSGERGLRRFVSYDALDSDTFSGGADSQNLTVVRGGDHDDGDDLDELLLTDDELRQAIEGPQPSQRFDDADGLRERRERVEAHKFAEAADMAGNSDPADDQGGTPDPSQGRHRTEWRDPTFDRVMARLGLDDSGVIRQQIDALEPQLADAVWILDGQGAADRRQRTLDVAHIYDREERTVRRWRVEGTSILRGGGVLQELFAARRVLNPLEGRLPWSGHECLRPPAQPTDDWVRNRPHWAWLHVQNPREPAPITMGGERCPACRVRSSRPETDGMCSGCHLRLHIPTSLPNETRRTVAA